MANKSEGKSFNLVYIVIAIAIVVAIVIGIFMSVNNGNIDDAKSASQITISDKDSNEVKIKKVQKKIELLSIDIDKVQEKIDPELEKLNKLYEEYVVIMNESQTGSTTSQEDIQQPTQEQLQEENSNEE